jgi:hypothetical protein
MKTLDDTIKKYEELLEKTKSDYYFRVSLLEKEISKLKKKRERNSIP